jgi:hypothetical protein
MIVPTFLAHSFAPVSRARSRYTCGRSFFFSPFLRTSKNASVPHVLSHCEFRCTLVEVYGRAIQWRNGDRVRTAVCGRGLETLKPLESDISQTRHEKIPIPSRPSAQYPPTPCCPWQTVKSLRTPKSICYTRAGRRRTTLTTRRRWRQRRRRRQRATVTPPPPPPCDKPRIAYARNTSRIRDTGPLRHAEIFLFPVRLRNLTSQRNPRSRLRYLLTRKYVCARPTRPFIKRVPEMPLVRTRLAHKVLH